MTIIGFFYFSVHFANMVVIDLQKVIPANPQQLLSTLTDHERLHRFFNADFIVIKGSDDGEIEGGKGCRRQVKSFGQTFVEEITEANLSGIKYHIVGSTPLKHHRGRINFESQGNKTLLKYHIEGITPNHLPDFIVRFAIKRDIDKAIKNLAKHFAK